MCLVAKLYTLSEGNLLLHEGCIKESIGQHTIKLLWTEFLRCHQYMYIYLDCMWSYIFMCIWILAIYFWHHFACFSLVPTILKSHKGHFHFICSKVSRSSRLPWQLLQQVFQQHCKKLVVLPYNAKLARIYIFVNINFEEISLQICCMHTPHT